MSGQNSPYINPISYLMYKYATTNNRNTIDGIIAIPICARGLRDLFLTDNTPPIANKTIGARPVPIRDGAQIPIIMINSRNTSDLFRVRVSFSSSDDLSAMNSIRKGNSIVNTTFFPKYIPATT